MILHAYVDVYVLCVCIVGHGWDYTILFTHRWRENNWIHTFHKDISAMWNAISCRIWTRVAVSISDGDNYYATSTIVFIYIYA